MLYDKKKYVNDNFKYVFEITLCIFTVVGKGVDEYEQNRTG